MKIVYTGRVAPIKNIEVVIRALKLVKSKKITFEIYGPTEKEYLEKLNKLISELEVEKKVKIIIKTYDRKEHIKKLDESLFFILPSRSEGMPQSLIEAMARQCIVIGSDNHGNKDLIEDGKNGFLFLNDDEVDLASTLDEVFEMSVNDLNAIGKKARKSVEKFRWDKIIDKIEGVIN